MKVMRIALLCALLVVAALTAALAGVPTTAWFTDNFASYDPGVYGIGLRSCSPNWQDAPEGGSSSMLRVQYYTNYGEATDYTGEGKFVEFKGDSHLGNNSHVQTTANFSSQSAGKLQIFHLMARRGTMQYYTPFPGRYKWFHASFNMRDSSNNDIACWAAGSCGLKAHLVTAPINYPVWDNHYYGMLPMGWGGGPTPVDTAPGVEWLFPDDRWHDFDITYDPATGVTKWFADGTLIWTQTQAAGRAAQKIWVGDVCLKPGAWTWEDHVSTDQMSIGTTGTPVVVAPVGATTVNTLRPTIAWNNSAPNDPRIAYQVKIVSSDSSGGATVYDSGTVSGAATIYNIPSDLSATGQRWAFVREQHKVAGWSAWSPTGNGGFYINTGLPGPQPVTSFTATAGNAQAVLAWTNPGGDFTGTMIRFKTTGYPTSATDGTQIYNSNSNGTGYTHTGLTNGATYYYCAFAHNATPAYATQRYAKAAPVAPDIAAPGPVTKFTTTKVAGKIEVAWRNPSDPDTTGVMIRYSATGYPATRSDGILLVDQAGTANSSNSYIHTDVSMETVYYYKAFAHDAGPNYNAGVQAVSTLPGLRIHPENSHYFQDCVTGKPVMITAFTSIVPTSTNHNYTAGIADIQSHRIEYSRVWHFLPWEGSAAIWPWGRSAQGGAPMGGNKIDMNTWNSTYWTRMKDAVSKANDGGTMASILLFDRCGISPSGSTRWQGNPWASNNNVNGLETPDASSDGTPEFYYWDVNPIMAAQQEKYVRKMVDETIAYPNVMYEAENEHWEWENPWFGWHICDYTDNYIKTNYPTSPRLISYNSICPDDLETFYSIDSCSVVNRHWGNQPEVDPNVLNDYIEPRWAYNKAINVDEFANGVGDYATMAKMCWVIIASGGNFHIEDAEPTISYDVVENIRSFKAQSGWDFIHAAPNKALITSGSGYCMAQPGVEYLCFFLTGGNKTITLLAGTYTARWWNPRTGGFSNASTFSHGGGGKTLSAPDSSYWVLQISSRPAATAVLESRYGGAITIDGNAGDWNLASFTNKICGGDSGTGNTAVVGYSGPVCYSGAHSTTSQYPVPNAADNAVNIYSRHDSSHLYFLMRFDDSDIRYPNAASANTLNDCVEIYIDPSHNHGSTAMPSGSTSDAQIVIDANNQRNVYGTTSGYATQILGGITSAVVRDGTGWWLEARIAKNVFSPAIPASTGTIGLDFNIRDNDQNLDAQSTSYTWRESSSVGFPSKIPDRWGDLSLLLPGNVTPPGPVTSFTATSGAGRVTLQWHTPPDADFTGTMIRYKTTGYPTSPSDGFIAGDKAGSPDTNDSYVHLGPTAGVTYYYSAFAHDAAPNYATKADASTIPTADTSAPGPVTTFAASPGDTQVSLTWHNPSDGDFAGAMIRYKTNGYPTSTTDGTLAVDKSGSAGANDEYTHSGLTNGIPYYYSAFAHDSASNYATKADAIATPWAVGVATLNVKPAGTITINASSTDWNLSEFTTKVRGGENILGDIAVIGFDGGALYKGGYWTGGALPTSAADHTARVYSCYDATYMYFLVRCDDNQMNYGNATSANWANDCIEFYFDPGHDHGSTGLVHPGTSISDIQLVIDCNNQKNAYCVTSGYAGRVLAGVTSAVARDATGWWLEARIDKNALDPDIPANGSFGVDFCFRDNDSPDAINYAGNPAQSTVYSWRDSAVAEGFPTKVPTAWGDALLQQDTASPGIVTSFIATGGDTQTSLSWHNPSDADFKGTTIRYRTDTYPTNSGDGSLLVDKLNTPNTNDTTIHTGLTNGKTYYYAAFAHDVVPNHSTAATATATAAADATIPQAKGLNDNDVRALRGNVVTAVFSDCFYIQDPLGKWGIRGINASVSQGQKVDVIGKMKGGLAERYIDCADNNAKLISAAPPAVLPTSMANVTLGGADLSLPLAPGVAGATGPNNLGILVCVWGKITQIDRTGQFFYIDDGSGLRDGTQTDIGPAPGVLVDSVGVRVKGPTSYISGEYVVVTGISSCFPSGGLARQVLPRAGEIVKL